MKWSFKKVPPAFSVSIPGGVVNRLEGIFRRPDGAGAFCRWGSVDHLFSDKTFRDVLVQAIQTEISDLNRREIIHERRSIELDFPHPIGWSSTIPRSSFPGIPSVVKALNECSIALFIETKEVSAPKTFVMTIVGEFFTPHHPKTKHPDWLFVIYSFYPGTDIGDIAGWNAKTEGIINISDREDVYFFPFGHPGERID